MALRNLSAIGLTARADFVRAMWFSYGGVLDAFMSNSPFVDAEGQASLTGLVAKLLRFDFVWCLMFMGLVLWMTFLLKCYKERI